MAHKPKPTTQNFSSTEQLYRLLIPGIIIVAILIFIVWGGITFIKFLIPYLFTWWTLLGVVVLIVLIDWFRSGSTIRKTFSKNQAITSTPTTARSGPRLLTWIVWGIGLLILFYSIGRMKGCGERHELEKVADSNRPLGSVAVNTSYGEPAPSWPEGVPYQALTIGPQTFEPGVQYRYERDGATKYYFAAPQPTTAQVTIHKLGNDNVYVVQHFTQDGSAKTIESHNDGSPGWKYVTVDQEVTLTVSGVINSKQ